MANSFIKPQAADTVGLAAAFSGMGQDVKNSNVLATHFIYNWGNDALTFDAMYFYNATHRLAYLANPTSAPPTKVESYIVGSADPNKSMVDQCLDFLLAQTPFNGSQASTLVWIKS